MDGLDGLHAYDHSTVHGSTGLAKDARHAKRLVGVFRERCKPVRDNDGIINGITELVGDIRTDNSVVEVFKAGAGLKAQ